MRTVCRLRLFLFCVCGQESLTLRLLHCRVVCVTTLSLVDPVSGPSKTHQTELNRRQVCNLVPRPWNTERYSIGALLVDLAGTAPACQTLLGRLHTTIF